MQALLYLIIDIGTDKIIETFFLIPIHLYFISLVLIIPRILIYSIKWQYLSRKQGMDFDILYLVKIFLIGLFYGSVTPGALGWHLRIYYLKNKSKSTIEKCIVNSLLDSATGFISGVFLALIGSIGQGTGVVLAKKGIYFDSNIIVNPLSAALIRMFIAAIFIWICVLILGKIPELKKAIKLAFYLV